MSPLVSRENSANLQKLTIFPVLVADQLIWQAFIALLLRNKHSKQAQCLGLTAPNACRTGKIYGTS